MSCSCLRRRSLRREFFSCPAIRGLLARNQLPDGVRATNLVREDNGKRSSGGAQRTERSSDSYGGAKAVKMGQFGPNL